MLYVIVKKALDIDVTWIFTTTITNKNMFPAPLLLQEKHRITGKNSLVNNSKSESLVWNH